MADQLEHRVVEVLGKVNIEFVRQLNDATRQIGTTQKQLQALKVELRQTNDALTLFGRVGNMFASLAVGTS